VVKKRLIPVVLLRNRRIVQSRRFARYNIIGDPTPAVARISSWSSDELIYLDITDHASADTVPAPIDELIPLISRKCSVPLTFGGGIRTPEDARLRLRLGADKVALNTAAIDDPAVVEKIATLFGAQCVVISVDVKRDARGAPEVYKRGRTPTGRSPGEFAKSVERLGAGEILLNSVDRDGTGQGFDLEIIQEVCAAVRIPVVALGGAGNWQHFADVLSSTCASAVAGANIFHHSENSVHHCKRYLFDAGIPVRRPPPLSVESSLL
jgi:imidazole glycerol-phosphate synthase subunit HisF